MLDDQFREAVSLAAEISKQLITLAIGILGVTVTVVARFARRISVWQLWLLIPAWFCYLAAIMFALWHLSALTGNLLARPLNMAVTSARVPALLQVFAFALGTALVVVFAVWFGIAAVMYEITKQRESQHDC